MDYCIIMQSHLTVKTTHRTIINKLCDVLFHLTSAFGTAGKLYLIRGGLNSGVVAELHCTLFAVYTELRNNLILS